MPLETPTTGRSGLMTNMLVRHLAVIVAAKLLILFALWWAFFYTPDNTPVTSPDVARHIMGPNGLVPHPARQETR